MEKILYRTTNPCIYFTSRKMHVVYLLCVSEEMNVPAASQTTAGSKMSTDDVPQACCVRFQACLVPDHTCMVLQHAVYVPHCAYRFYSGSSLHTRSYGGAWDLMVLANASHTRNKFLACPRHDASTNPYLVIVVMKVVGMTKVTIAGPISRNGVPQD